MMHSSLGHIIYHHNPDGVLQRFMVISLARVLKWALYMVINASFGKMFCYYFIGITLDAIELIIRC